MKKLTVFVIIFLFSISCIPVYSQVFDTDPDWSVWSYKPREYEVKSKPIITKCHKVETPYLHMQFNKKGIKELLIEHIASAAIDYPLWFIDAKHTTIVISNDEVIFKSKTSASFSVKYLGKEGGLKKYQFSGTDSDGISFKLTMVGEKQYDQYSVKFWRYSRYDDKDYADFKGYEDMAGDEPVLLELVKHWAKQFKHSKISYM